MDTSKVTRFEVIDRTHREASPTEVRALLEAGAKGRVVVMYGVNAELSLQDDGRTLKVFLTDKEN